MNSYLIPANAKRGKLIFGLFREIDLIIFLVGVVTTFILMLALPVDHGYGYALTAIAPVLICSFLVAPIPHYHNVMTFFGEMYEFFSQRQKFVWKGWCFLDGSNEEK